MHVTAHRDINLAPPHPRHQDDPITAPGHGRSPERNRQATGEDRT